MLEPLADWIINIYNQMYGSGEVFDTIKRYNDLYAQLLETDVFQMLAAAIMSIGIAMMLLFFFIDLADKIKVREFTMEQFIRAFIGLLISFFLIVNSLDLLKAFVEFGEGLAGILNESSEPARFFENTENVEKFAKGVGKIDIFPAVGYAVKTLVPALISWIASIVVIFIAVSRLVEMTIRTVFAPFAVADCYQDGSRSNGIRYLKKFLALALQFALIVGINIGVAFIMKQVIGGDAGMDMTAVFGDGKFAEKDCMEFLDNLLGGDDFWLCMGLLVTKIGLMIKSMSIANDIVGV